MRKHLLQFGVEQAKRGAYARLDRGFQIVEVRRIVGSVGRAGELDGEYRCRSRSPGAQRDARVRLARVRALFDAGRVPPVDLYQIGDDYFVVDGHHRVAVARERGQLDLDAHVIAYLPDPRDPGNVVYYERRAFIRATGLHDARVTEPGRYPRLLSRIQSYGHELTRRKTAGNPADGPRLWPISTYSRGHAIDCREAAHQWYEVEYRLVAEALTAERVDERFAGREMGDLYGYVSDHRWYLSERRGWDVGLDVALVDFVHRFAPETPSERLIDPIVALGSDILDRLEMPRRGVAHRLAASTVTALGVGMLAVPMAFLRGLRPRLYRFPRLSQLA